MTEQYIIALISAGAGLFGVMIGSAISWLQARWLSKKDREKIEEERDKAARYLAIRAVCVLDKFLVECTNIVKDKNSHGFTERKEDDLFLPSLSFPSDVDWKSIDPELMYELLSFPTDVENSHVQIRMAWEIETKDRMFGQEERAFHYAQFGLHACKLINGLCKTYGIKPKTYNDPNYDPVLDLTNERDHLYHRRIVRFQHSAEILRKAGMA
jgi:hypothetical protein